MVQFRIKCQIESFELEDREEYIIEYLSNSYVKKKKKKKKKMKKRMTNDDKIKCRFRSIDYEYCYIAQYAIDHESMSSC